MKNSPNLRLDAIVWGVIMVLAALTAFSLLKRDADRHFGAMSFGAFPQFSLKTTDGSFLDHHLLKGRVWVVHAAMDSQKASALAQELVAIANRTASGKRYLNVLSMLESDALHIDSFGKFHYIVHIGPSERGFILSTFGARRDGIVLLVDQNSVIRGRYDVKDVDGLRSFQGDLLKIL